MRIFGLKTGSSPLSVHSEVSLEVMAKAKAAEIAALEEKANGLRETATASAKQAAEDEAAAREAGRKGKGKGVAGRRGVQSRTERRVTGAMPEPVHRTLRRAATSRALRRRVGPR